MALIKCTKCGHEISEKAIICPKCGTSIQKEKTSKGWKKSIVAVLFCVFSIALIGLFVYVFATKSSGEQLSREKQDDVKNGMAFVRFSDVFINRMSTEESHINCKLHEYLQKHGYKLLKQETTSEYYEVFESTLSQEHYYLGVNMEYENEKWRSLGTPCNGVEVVIGEPNNYVIVKFQNEEELKDFISDAEKSGFNRDDDTWSRDGVFPHDDIVKKDATTLECSSSFPI